MLDPDPARGGIEGDDETRKGATYAVVFTWPDGREEIRYRREVSDSRCAWEVAGLHRAARRGGWASPYSLRRTL